ncbi:MAG: AAA family ATPase [Planctomycetota bacterium]|nr:MAG: AAA family ATPase [Planctomycetota bacterium]
MDIIGVCDKCQKKYKSASRKDGDTKECKCGGLITFGSGESTSSASASIASTSAKITSSVKQDNSEDQEKVIDLGKSFGKIKKEIAKKIIGQNEIVEQLLVSVFAGGHCLLEGVPGLAKTLLINSLCEALHLDFKRIQFTPDMMPSDITGTEIIQDDENGNRMYKFLPGPIFSNIVLADEINRTPPKTQAALLEAMQEKQVSIGGKVYTLDKPFFVMATMNPIDQEGTYSLPEAQQDRFLFKIYVDYPSFDEEIEIAETVTSGITKDIVSVVSGEEILDFQGLIKRAPVARHVLEYAVRLVRATRKEKDEAPDFVKEWINIGAGPRACLALISAAKARAILHGRYHVATEDIAAISGPVFRHRISPNFGAQAEGINSDKLVERLIEEIPQNV